MIVSFRSKALKRFWEKSDRRGLNPQHAVKIEQLLSGLDASTKPDHMNSPGFDFHKLHGDIPPRWSVHVNGNWCITFAFDGGNAVAVDYLDYH
jgi:toxin HigB-1